MGRRKRKILAWSEAAKKRMKAYWDKVKEEKSRDAATQPSTSRLPRAGQGQEEQLTAAAHRDKLLLGKRSKNHDGSKSVTRSTIRLDTGSQTHPRATSTETSSEDTCPVSPATGSSEHELLYDDVDLKVEIKEEVVDDMPNFVDVEQVEEPLKIEDDPVDALAKLEPSFPSASTSSTGETVRTTAFRVPDADEFHLFGMFVASQLRAMPMRDALQAQLEIQTILAQKRSERLT